MEVPDKLNERAAAAARRIASGRSASAAPVVTISGFEAMQHDGVSGNELLRASATWSTADGSGGFGLVAKLWERAGWVCQLLGSGTPAESLLVESGLTARVNSVSGMCSPVMEAVRAGDQAWTIMEDVSDELDRWKTMTSAGPPFPAERLLLDRMARMHAAFEAPSMQRELAAVAGSLVTAQRRLHWLADVGREWISDGAPDPAEPPELRAAKKSLEWGRGLLHAFLEWLPQADRAAWRKHMLDRRDLVAAAAGLPETLIHGDVTPRNVGIRPGTEEDTVVLIDWELSGRGTPAFDLVHFLGNPPLRAATNSDDLIEHYHERYAASGGKALDRSTWQRSLDMALVHYGVGLFPVYAGMALAGADAAATAAAARVVGRVRKAMAALRL